MTFECIFPGTSDITCPPFEFDISTYEITVLQKKLYIGVVLSQVIIIYVVFL